MLRPKVNGGAKQDVVDDIAAGRLVRLLEDWTPPRPGFSPHDPGRHKSAGFKASFAMVKG